MKDRVHQHIDVSPSSAPRCQQSAVSSQYIGCPCVRRAPPVPEQIPLAHEENQGSQSECAYTNEKASPADDRFKKNSKGGTESHASGHRSKQPAERTAPLFVREEIAHQGEPHRHNPAC